MGTALTEHHLYLVKRYTRRIVLAMDSDAAGASATLRGLRVARQTLDREEEARFDARGLLRWEGRLQADIRVSALPEGMDPDDVVNRNPQDWETLVAQAKPVVEHVMETLAKGRDLGDPKVKTEIASQVMPLIGDLPSVIERDTYRQKLARLLRVDERTLERTGSFRPLRSRSRPRTQSAEPETVATSLPGIPIFNHKREVHILGVLIRRPDLIYRIDRFLQEDGLQRISEADFENIDHQILIKLLMKSLDQNDIEPLDYVLNHLSDPMMKLTDAILEQTEGVNLNRDDILEDILRALVMVREHQISQRFEMLRFLQETAQENGDLKASEYRDTILDYTLLRGRIHKAISRYTHRSFLDVKE
jgi:DNA primase